MSKMISGFEITDEQQKYIRYKKKNNRFFCATKFLRSYIEEQMLDDGDYKIFKYELDKFKGDIK